MRYLLMIYGEELDPATVDPAAQAAEFQAYDAFTREIRESGAYLGGEALEPTTTATTVRVVDGQIQTTDGPFAETKEAIGGYYLVEAKDLDEAIGWAAKIPTAKHGSIEIRPIWELPDDYASGGATAGAAAGTSAV